MTQLPEEVHLPLYRIFRMVWDPGALDYQQIPTDYVARTEEKAAAIVIALENEDPDASYIWEAI